MHAIYKYELGVLEKQELELPENAKIIRVDDVDGRFYLWAVVDITKIDLGLMETRKFEFYKTGQPIDKLEGLEYLGFCKVFVMQELGLYVFERTN